MTLVIANTIWRPNSGKGEYAGITAQAIVDPTGVALVDPVDSTIAIVSPTVTFTDVPATVWAENEGV